MIGALVLVLASGIGSAGQTAPKELPIEVRVPHMRSAKAQLAHARGLKRSMQTRPEKDKPFWRRLAVEAYFAVDHYHPDQHGFAAEAYFRAGELLRAKGDAEAAEEAFRKAASRGRGTPFRARARLEIGHLARRGQRYRLAIDAYLEVAADAKSAAMHRDDAWLWAGRVWQMEGRVVDARRAWKGVAEEGAHPLDRILAYDYWALSYIDEKDPEAAAGVFNEALRALASVALEETEMGARVRKSLQRMRVIDALERVAEEREQRRLRSSEGATTSERDSSQVAGRPRKP